MHVRERIAINGRALSEAQFAHHFWPVYSRLLATADVDTAPMPAYFKCLTLVAFNAFLLEQVDVAVVEVGIGGQTDSTNVIRYVVACKE